MLFINDQDGEAEYHGRMDLQQRVTSLPARSDEAIARTSAAALKRQFDRQYREFTEGMPVDAAALLSLAEQLVSTVNVAQEARQGGPLLRLAS